MNKMTFGSAVLLTLHATTSFAVISANLHSFPYKLAQQGTGGIYAAVKDEAENALYIAGTFTGIGRDSGGGALFETNSNPINTSIKYNGTVYSSLPDTHGGFYVAGTFTSVDGDDEAKYLVHINADGSLDQSFKPHMPEKVYQIKRLGNELYAETTKYRTIYQVDMLTGQINPSFHVTTNLPIQAMDVTPRGLFIGGVFTSVNNQHIGSYFAKLDLVSGQVDRSFYKSKKKVSNILHSSDELLYLNTKDGQLIKLDENTGKRDLSFSANVGLPLRMAVDHDKVWATYRFSPYIKRFNLADGSEDVLVLPLNGMLRDITFDDKYVYLAGGFRQVDGNMAINHLARFNKYTLAVDTNFHPMIDGGQALTVSVNNSHVFTGGSFNTAYGIEQPYLAKINATTGEPDRSFKPVLDYYPVAMALHGDDLFIGGSFNKVDGNAVAKMAKISKKTGKLKSTGFDMSPNWPVYTMKVHGDYLYVGGMFNVIANSTSTPYLARFNLITDKYDNSFSLSGLNNRVFAMGFDGGSLYVGGKFTDKLAKYDIATGNRDTTFRPYTRSTQVDGVVVYNDALYASVRNANGIEKFDKLTGVRDANTPYLGRYGYALAKQNNLLLVSSYGAATCIDMDDDTIVPQLTFNTAYKVNRMIPFNDLSYFIAGQFTSIAGHDIKHLAKVTYTDE
ncbi:MAG: delta-60 repeat domain-containing protein [Coxiellaceae bacterium]|nr:delta-60 repeat domain-containing protein [Coxiellaceae bacterium]